MVSSLGNFGFRVQSWARDVLAYVRFDCDAMTRQAAKHRARLAKFSAAWDAKHSGGRQAFASIKEPPHPPFSSLPVSEKRTLTLSQAIDGQQAWYAGSQVQYLRHHCPAKTDVGPAIIVDDRPNFDGGIDILLQVTGANKLAHCPPSLHLQQQTVACSPEELTREFHEFWHCIWNRARGSARTDPARWEAALADLPALPQGATPLTLVHADLQAWKDALRKMRPSKATGYCGFSVKELKTLPDESLTDLSNIFGQATVFGYPRHPSKGCGPGQKIPPGEHESRSTDRDLRNALSLMGICGGTIPLTTLVSMAALVHTG